MGTDVVWNIGDVAAGGTGSVTFTVSVPGDGSYDNTASGSFQVGLTNFEVTSNTTSTTVDTAAPAPPVVVDPADGSSTSDTTPDITGTAEAGADVDVYVDGVLVGTVVAAASGDWTYTLTSAQALSDGSHTASAIAIDAAGNPSAPSNVNTFTVDNTPPGDPVVVLPADGSTIGDDTPHCDRHRGARRRRRGLHRRRPRGHGRKPTLQGTGTTRSHSAQALSDGAHDALVQSPSHAAGNRSGDSNTNTFTIDTVAAPRAGCADTTRWQCHEHPRAHHHGHLRAGLTRRGLHRRRAGRLRDHGLRRQLDLHAVPGSDTSRTAPTPWTRSPSIQAATAPTPRTPTPLRLSRAASLTPSAQCRRQCATHTNNHLRGVPGEPRLPSR